MTLRPCIQWAKKLWRGFPAPTPLIVNFPGSKSATFCLDQKLWGKLECVVIEAVARDLRVAA